MNTQNRKTEVFWHKNRKTDLKNSQNRKTENPNVPLLKQNWNVDFLLYFNLCACVKEVQSLKIGFQTAIEEK